MIAAGSMPTWVSCIEIMKKASHPDALETRGQVTRGTVAELGTRYFGAQSLGISNRFSCVRCADRTCTQESMATVTPPDIDRRRFCISGVSD